jgi:putative selenate reductase FAD-binding subunit
MLKNEYVALDANDALVKIKENPQYVFLAGGTEIDRPNSSIQCQGVINLNKLGLDTIEKINGKVKIGSCVTFQQLEESPLIPLYLKKAALYCEKLEQRQKATIGGNLALGRDDSFLMPTLLAAKARLLTYGLTSDGVLTDDNVPIREYHAYHSEFSSTLLIGVLLPEGERFVQSAKYNVDKKEHSAVNAAFGAYIDSEGRFNDVRVFAAIKGSGIQRFGDIENGIENNAYTDSRDIQYAISAACLATDDEFGTASYKRYISGKAIESAYIQAKGHYHTTK